MITRISDSKPLMKHISCEYLGSIIGDSVITCDEIIEAIKTVPIKTITTKTIPTKTIPINFNEKIVTCKIEKFYTLITLLLITVLLLIIVCVFTTPVTN